MSHDFPDGPDYNPEPIDDDPWNVNTDTEGEAMPIAERLEYLRSQIDAESISWGEIAELQGLADHIDPSDVQLLEWAGVPEFPSDAA